MRSVLPTAQHAVLASLPVVDVLAPDLSRNVILANLSPGDLAELAPHLSIVALTRGQSTNQVDQPLQNVDFPLDAMVSVMATLSSGSLCEVSFVGREGFVEADAALRAGEAARMTICQIPGAVARMPAAVFSENIAKMPAFDAAIRRSLRLRLFVTEQIAACNLRHTVVERLARWLLTTHDQMGKPQISLTQETFAVMLGVRRAGVSEAANALARTGAVHLERAAITIVDRAVLQTSSCECYGVIRSLMQRESVPLPTQ